MLNRPQIYISFLGILFLFSCGSQPSYLAKSEGGIGAPDPQKSFEQYVKETEQIILQQLTDKQTPANFQHNGYPAVCSNNGDGCYTIEDAAKMRAPFQRPIDSSMRCTDKKGANTGFLLIHGLTDSPYLMTGLADSMEKHYPCALIRAIVLPGHSTVPGHSLSMTYQQWLLATEFGINSFNNDDSIDSVYVMTFSTGGPLLIRHLADSKINNQKVKGAVLVSAAVKAKSSSAFLAPLVQHFISFSGATNEQDAARYESFSMHAGAEFYKLTKVINNDKERYQFKKPLFIAISADDTTVSAEAALNYFCDASASTKQLVWYEHAKSKEPFAQFETAVGECKNDIRVRQVENIGGVPDNYVSFSHTALSMPPSDPHYGKKPKYKQCKAYFDAKNHMDSEFMKCVDADTSDSLTGENTDHLKELAKKQGVPWRRGTYNADYQYMEEQILKFLDSIE